MPYRPDTTPFPWLPGIRPSVQYDLFTNPDHRLRPQWKLPYVGGIHSGYLVTPRALPELSREFEALQTRAGVRGLSLVISDQIQPFAGRFSPSENRIYISRNRFNAFGFDELLTVLAGHEVGHAWRRANPNAGRMRTFQPMSDAKYYEYEADLLGACLRGTTDGYLSWMAKNHEHGSPENYPTNGELREAFQKLQWRDCPVDVPNHLPQVPPLLRAPVKRK